MGLFSSKKNGKLRVGGQVDPLRHGPAASQDLFKQFSRLCNGFPTDAAIAASANVLLNALRQQSATRREAEIEFNELFGRLKAILVEHYDGPSGRRRNVFPFHQTVEVPFMDFRNKR
jgi:hypothetical protein